MRLIAPPVVGPLATFFVATSLRQRDLIRRLHPDAIVDLIGKPTNAERKAHAAIAERQATHRSRQATKAARRADQAANAAALAALNEPVIQKRRLAAVQKMSSANLANGMEPQAAVDAAFRTLEQAEYAVAASAHFKRVRAGRKFPAGRNGCTCGFPLSGGPCWSRWRHEHVRYQSQDSGRYRPVPWHARRRRR